MSTLFEYFFSFGYITPMPLDLQQQEQQQQSLYPKFRGLST